MAESRRPITREEFIEQVASTEIGKAAAAMLWEKLHEDDWIYDEIYDVFSPYPGDDLRKIYGMDEEELDEDTILHIIMELNLAVPKQESVNKFGRVDTPRKLIKFIERISSLQSSAGG